MAVVQAAIPLRLGSRVGAPAHSQLESTRLRTFPVPLRPLPAPRAARAITAGGVPVGRSRACLHPGKPRQRRIRCPAPEACRQWPTPVALKQGLPSRTLRRSGGCKTAAGGPVSAALHSAPEGALIEKVPNNMKTCHSLPARVIASVVVTAFLAAALPVNAYAAMIATDTVAQQTSRAENLAKVRTMFSRQDVAQRLQSLGVDPVDALQRAAALSDADLAQLSVKADQLPAGGDGGLFALIGVVFVVLLLLDYLDVIHVFHHRR